MQVRALSPRARVELSCVGTLDRREDLVEIAIHLGMRIEDVAYRIVVE
jgi:hypothetical protein